MKHDLIGANTYKLQASLTEKVIVDGYGCQTALTFSVKAKENKDNVPTLYWLPKLHTKPYKAYDKITFLIVDLLANRYQNM